MHSLCVLYLNKIHSTVTVWDLGLKYIITITVVAVGLFWIYLYVRYFIIWLLSCDIVMLLFIGK